MLASKAERLADSEDMKAARETKKATTLCRNAVGLRFHEPASKVGAKSLGASYLADAPKSTGANRTSNLGEIRPPADLFIGSAEIRGSARTWQRVVALNRTPVGNRGQVSGWHVHGFAWA